MANELENKIQKLSADYAFNETLCSLLLLLISVSDDAGGNGIAISLNPHDDILQIKEFVKNSVINMENLLNEDPEARSNELIKSLEVKKRLIYIYENFYSYYSELSIVSNIINDETALRKYKEQNISTKNIDFAGFYTDIIDFINGYPPNEQPSAISRIAKCIPLKITRDKYYDIIKNSLKLAFKGHSQDSIDFALKTFKFTCYPEINSEYGKYFPDIAEYLKKAKHINPSELNDEELDAEFADFDNMFEIMSDIDEYFKALFNDINSLIILYYANFSFDDLVENEFIISDIYHSVCEFITNPEDELINEIFTEKTYPLLEENTEILIDKSNAINKKEYKLLENIKDFNNIEDETAKLLASEGFIRSHYYAEINEEIFNFGGDMFSVPATDEYKETKFNEFIDVLKQCFSNLEPKSRKAAMQIFLGSLPAAINIYEFMDIVKTAIETAPTFEHKVLIIDKVGMLFDETGFNYNPEVEHTHSHGCGCDHEHHDHDCGCGHTH